MGADVEKERERQERHRKTLEFAAAHEQPLTPGIEFTQSNADLALLYGDLQRGQLSMRSLEHLSPATLDWIAAHTMKPEEDLDPEKWSKLRANAHRAGWLREKRIQEQRDRVQRRTEELFTDSDGALRMAYHAWTPGAVGYAAGGARSLHIAGIDFDDGRPRLQRSSG